MATPLEMTLVYASGAVVPYLIGSVPFGFLIGKMKGLDIRTQGSGKDAALAAFRLHGRSGAGRINLDIVLRRFAADRAGIEASRNLRAAFRTNTRHKNLPSISI